MEASVAGARSGGAHEAGEVGRACGVMTVLSGSIASAYLGQPLGHNDFHSVVI